MNIESKWGGYSSMERILSSKNGANIFLWTIALSKEYPLGTTGLMLFAEQIPYHQRAGNTYCGVFYELFKDSPRR